MKLTEEQIIGKCKAIIDSSTLPTLAATERYLTLVNRELINRYKRSAKGFNREFLFGDVELLHCWFAIRYYFEQKWGRFLPRTKVVKGFVSTHEKRGRLS